MRLRPFSFCVFLNTAITLATSVVLHLFDPEIFEPGQAVSERLAVPLAIAIWIVGFCATAWIVTGNDRNLRTTVKTALMIMNASVFCGYPIWIGTALLLELFALVTTGEFFFRPFRLGFIGYGLPVWTTGSLIVSIFLALRSGGHKVIGFDFAQAH